MLISEHWRSAERGCSLPALVSCIVELVHVRSKTLQTIDNYYVELENAYSAIVLSEVENRFNKAIQFKTYRNVCKI